MVHIYADVYAKLIDLLTLDLECVSGKGAFDGMIVKANLEELLETLPENSPLRVKVEEALGLYQHDGYQCYPEKARPRLAQLLTEIIAGLKEIKDNA